MSDPFKKPAALPHQGSAEGAGEEDNMINIGRARMALASLGIGVLVSACGGGGGDSGGAPPSQSGPTGTNAHVLFVSDYTTSAIAAFSTLTPTPGTNLTGDIVGTAPIGSSLAYDATRDILYAGGGGAPSNEPARIDVYEHASTLAAVSAPTRSILVPDFSTGEQIFLDAANDTIWFGGELKSTPAGVDVSNEAIEVFTHASTLSGTATPDRRIEDLQIQQFTVDVGRSILYVMGNTSTIAVYPNALAINGVVQPARLIGASYADAFAVDATRDILYLASSPPSQAGIAHVIISMPGASTQNLDSERQAAPIAPITLPALNVLSLVADPAHDRLYCGASGGALVIEGASTLAPGSTVSAVVVQAPSEVAVTSFAF